MKRFALTAEFSFPRVIGESKIVTFVNPTNYFQTRPKWNEFTQVFSDGILFTKLYGRRSGVAIERVSFDFGSIAESVFSEAINRNFRVALIGGKPREIAKAVQKIQKKFPKLAICFHTDGYGDKDLVLRELEAQKPDLLIVGLGSPLQEDFLIECKSKLPNPFLGYTCGGFLTQTSISENYYPSWVNRYNLRWLFRFFRHAHVRKKLLVDYPVFLVRWFTDIR
ncbi:WecB/TagA/CpsF family glycosyltransferase [Shimia sp.]|uniref:WecB/TagA/CpsF family glycosyltransferase n=1 Tax=Shimia sp. TaxID=1954381 RepID=UPI003BA98FAC